MMQALDESLTPIAESTSANSVLLQSISERMEEMKADIGTIKQSSDDLLALSVPEFKALKTMASSFMNDWREANKTQETAIKKLAIVAYVSSGLSVLMVVAIIVLLLHESHLFGR